jgi:glucose/arabinose dehydrogenase
MKRPRSVIAALAAVLLVSSIASAAQAAPSAFLTFVGSGFTRPVFVSHAGDNRLFVVEQGGYVKIVGGSTFLDIHTKVPCCGGEQGLLGLAFHPDYNNSSAAGFRRFYVTFTRASDGAIVLAEYRRSTGNVNAADPNSFRRLLVIPHPGEANHNGGWLGFKGSLLYMSTGDGGGAGDQPNNAQNKGSLLGKILRINPLPSGSSAYTIPKSNPFVGLTGLDQIWAFGLRNPWRCSFDRSTLYLWCGDVGQAAYEEIDRHVDGKGKNFGWRLLEGFHYYNSPGHTTGTLCTSSCKTLPIAEYAHSVTGDDNCSVTGGYVSRRSGAPLAGRYIFGDYCSGRIWTISAGFVAGSSLPAPAASAGFNISCFGEGADGRIYVCDLFGGAVYRVTDT